jgi:hypothetical protein
MFFHGRRKKITRPKMDKQRYRKTKQWAQEAAEAKAAYAKAKRDHQNETAAKESYARMAAARSLQGKITKKQPFARVVLELMHPEYDPVQAVPSFRDFYQVLDLPRTAITRDLKQAYVRRALLFHPDHAGVNNPTASHQWTETVEAYSTLIDPTKKQRYDLDLPVFRAVYKFYSEYNPGNANFIRISDILDSHIELHGDDYHAKLFAGLQKRYGIEIAYPPFESTLEEIDTARTSTTTIASWDLGAELGGHFEGAASPTSPPTLLTSPLPSASALGESGALTERAFEVSALLGFGAAGKVVLATHHATGKQYAIKMLYKKGMPEASKVNIWVERTVLSQLAHPFTAKLEFAFSSAGKLFIGIDYFSGGDLHHHMHHHGTSLGEPRCRFYAAEVLSALAHLHTLDIIYRDLKGANVMIASTGHVRLVDFGLAKLQADTPRSAFSLVGSPFYVAPEVLSNFEGRCGYGKAVDWWGMGVLIYEMLLGHTPFMTSGVRLTAENKKQLYHDICHSDVTFPPDVEIDANAKSLIMGLLDKEPMSRLGSQVSVLLIMCVCVSTKVFLMCVCVCVSTSMFRLVCFY